ncbi:hypothetical protein BJV78DRAFT_1134577, partial [Lactifluus subvellereus]
MWVLMNFASFYHIRFRQTNDPEDLEKAISRYREVLLLCPPDHESKDGLLINLGFSLTSRFENFGHMGCLEEAISLYHAALSLCPRGHPRRQLSLRGLANAMHLRHLRTHRIEDFQETINLDRENLALTPPGHPMRPQTLYHLSLSLQTQYTWTGNTDKDIADAIKHYRTSISLIPEGNPDFSSMLGSFANDL